MGKTFEAALVRALTYLAAAFDIAVERDVDLSDLDTDVAIDQLDCAGRHAVNALYAARPDLVDARPLEVVSVLAQMTDGIDLPDDFALLVDEAFEAFLDATDGAPCCAVVEELEWALYHLEEVASLLDPKIDGGIELEIDECRKRILAGALDRGSDSARLDRQP